jgi:toxin secretion/phage lysis holin
MDSIFNAKIAFAGIGTALSYFFGGFDKALIALIIFLCVDYITGILAAVYTKELNSSTGLQGIIKKVMQLFLVGVAAIIDSLTGLTEPYLRTSIVYFLIANEGISILENIARSGVKVPQFLKVVLEQIKNKEDKNE